MRRWHSIKVVFNSSGVADVAGGRLSRKSKWAWMIRFVSPYRTSKILSLRTICRYSDSVHQHIGLSLQISTLKDVFLNSWKEGVFVDGRPKLFPKSIPSFHIAFERFLFIAISFTESEAEPVGAGADCWFGPLLLNRLVESNRQLPIRRLAFWIALLSCQYIPHKCLYLLSTLYPVKGH